MKPETSEIRKKHTGSPRASRCTLHASGSRAFTILEIMVVLFFAGIVSSLVLTGYKELGGQGTLERAATRIAQDIRTAQTYALGAYTGPAGSTALPPCGFGFHAPNPATSDPDSYIIYGKFPSASSVPCGAVSKQWVGAPECFDKTTLLTAPCSPSTYVVSTSTVRTFVLPEAGKVKFSLLLFPTFGDAYFEPPDPKTTLLVINPLGTTSATATFIDFAIQRASNAAQVRGIRVTNFGRVEIVGGQKLAKVCVPLNCVAIGNYVCGTWADGCGSSFNCGPGGACSTPGDLCCTVGPCPTSVGQCYAGPPLAPASLSAQSISASEIDLTWTDNSLNESSFEVVRMDADCVSSPTTLTAPPNKPSPPDASVGLSVGTVTFADTGLPSDTQYCYKVRAMNFVSGPSGYSNTATTYTRPPSPTWGVANKIGPGYTPGGYIFVRWNDSHSPTNVTGYHLWRAFAGCGSTGPVCGAFTEIVPTAGPLGPAARNFLDKSPDDPSQPDYYSWYCYRVNSTGPGGDSVFTPDKISSAATDDVSPPAPTIGTPVAVSGGEIDVKWNATSAGTCGGIPTSFTVKRCTGSGCDPASSGTTYNPGFSGTGAFTYPDTSVGSNVYRYCVVANGGVGSSACSGPTADIAPLPAAPTLVSATSTGLTAAQVRWTDNTTFETTNVVERGPAGGSCSGFAAANTIGAVAGSGTTRTDADTLASPALVSETKYCYRMRTDAPGSSVYSGTAVIRTWLKTPTGFAAVNSGNRKITVSWTDNSSVESGYKIERCQNLGCSNFAEVNVVGTNVTSWQNTGLLNATDYCYRVRATSPEADSAYSATACANSG